MSMDIFGNVLGNIDENYPFSLSPKTHFGSIGTYWHMCIGHRNYFHMVQEENFSHFLHSEELNKIGSFLK